MTAVFAPIDLSTVAEPVDLADTLTEHPETPEFNEVVVLYAGTIKGLRTQKWPIVAEDTEAEPEAEPETEPEAVPEAPDAPAAEPAQTDEEPADDPAANQDGE